jgi:diguanylate cyclase (GGDEF)-like protein/PAS domain S-box-containing protein
MLALPLVATASKLKRLLARRAGWTVLAGTTPVFGQEGATSQQKPGDAETIVVLERLASAMEAHLAWSQALAFVGIVALLAMLVVLFFILRPHAARGGESLLPAAPSPLPAAPAQPAMPEADANRWEFVLEGTGHGVWDLNPMTGEVVFSPAWRRMLGYLPEDVPNTLAAWRSLIHPEDQPKVRKAFESLLAGESETRQVSYRMRTRLGDYRWVETSAHLMRDPAGRPRHMIGTNTDITGQRELEQHLEQLMVALNESETHFRRFFDALTGLPNRNLLAERLGQALKQARREGSRVAVMFIDLDFFKQVNDTLGHAVGDRLLQLVAERMRMCVRETDTIARLGGDEFVILLMDIDAIAPAGIIAEKLIGQMVEPFVIEGNEIHIGASIGITIFPDDGRDIDTLFRNADLAMYRAKTMGRNNTQFFEPALTTAALDRRALEIDLRGALSRHEFRLHFLPLVNLASGRIMGVEALLRWQHPQRGLLEPHHFLPLAEETGLIREIGGWALDEACRQLAAWETAGHNLTLAINVSVRQLPEALAVKNILAVLYKYGLSPLQLMLEITESVLLAESPAIQQWFVDAGTAGLNLSIDDFGTGYSSLAYLKRFPVRHVKIDKTFIKDMAGDAGNRALVEAILAMANSLGLSVIAEGVENAGQASLLQARSCELAQGYLYSQPLPADELLTLLKNPAAGGAAVLPAPTF